MSKSPPLYGDDDDSDLPPPYTLTTTTASSSSSPPSLLLTTPLTTHLATLSSRLSSAAAHHRASRDADAATRAVPHVADFLARLEAAAAAPPSANRRFPSRAELVLVPAAAVPRGWALSGGAERRRDGEIVRVGRVEGEGGKAEGKGEKGRGKGKGKGEKGGDGDWAAADSNDDDDDEDNDGRRTGDVVGEFDEWGRWNDEPTNGGSASTGDLMWWRDECMAMRVATHLRPAEKVVVERRQVQAAVEKAKEERKGWGWRRNKSDAAKTTPPVTSQPLITVEPVPGTGAEGADDRATMTVRADEVTFRKESELGVWESLNGFGIVITVHIRKP